jgi:plasmid stability protein
MNNVRHTHEGLLPCGAVQPPALAQSPPLPEDLTAAMKFRAYAQGSQEHGVEADVLLRATLYEESIKKYFLRMHKIEVERQQDEPTQMERISEQLERNWSARQEASELRSAMAVDRVELATNERLINLEERHESLVRLSFSY